MPSGGGKEVNEDFSFVGIFIFETFVPNIWSNKSNKGCGQCRCPPELDQPGRSNILDCGFFSSKFKSIKGAVIMLQNLIPSHRWLCYSLHYSYRPATSSAQDNTARSIGV